MEALTTNVKKLNIFQKLRLKFAYRQTSGLGYNLEKFKKEPYYIQNDTGMIARLAHSENIDIEELREKIRPELLCSVKNDYDFIRGYPLEVVSRLIKNGIVSPYYYDENTRLDLLKDLIRSGDSQILKTDNWGYAERIHEQIYQEFIESGEFNEAHSMLEFFDESLLKRFVINDPKLIEYLNLTQKAEYEKVLSEKVKSLRYTEDVYKYVSPRLSTFKYLPNTYKKNFIRQGLNDGLDVWQGIDGVDFEDEKLYFDEILRLRSIEGGEELIKLNAKNFPAKKLAIELCNRETVSNLEFSESKIILDNMTDAQLADFFGYARNKIPEFEERYNLDKVLLAYNKFECIHAISKENRMPMIDKFKELALEEQLKYIDKENGLLEYIPIVEQERYINGRPELVKYASLEGKKLYIKNHPNDFLKIDDTSKIELAAEDARLFDFLPENIKTDIKYCMSRNDRYSKIYGKILRRNMNESKNFTYEIYGDSEVIPNAFEALMENSDKLSKEEILDYVLHSKLCSAIGKLTHSSDIIHESGAKEAIGGIDSWTKKQIRVIQGLKPEVVAELTKIDSNYVLPYIAFSKENSKEDYNVLQGDEILRSKERSKELFTRIFGEEKFKELENCFEIVYELEEKYSNNVSNSNGRDTVRKVSDFEQYKNYMNVPLEEFKILFNSKIIESCDNSLLQSYFMTLQKGENPQKYFEEIINKSYGQKAVNILKSRPQLNVHSINSLECFDSKILDEYGEAFVHDTISYNIRNFSEFLEIVKSPEKSEVFKNYYEILANALGSNVETMQKAITEFSYVSQLLEDVKDKDMSEEQVLNLMNVLCSERNPFNISSKEDLERYNEIANSQLNDFVTNISKTNLSDVNYDAIKEMLCNNLFGINLKENYTRTYGKSLEMMTNLYDLSKKSIETMDLSMEEQELINNLRFISEETSANQLINFIRNLDLASNKRNFLGVNKLLDRIQEQELSMMNEQITTLEKLDEICQQQSDRKNPTVYKEEIEGVQVYHLNGEKFTLFSHDAGNTSLDEILNHESQGANMAICTRLTTEKMGVINNRYLYGSVAKQGLITIRNADANTQHVAKRTKMAAVLETKVNELDKVTKSGNEVAFYRNERKHSQISNENAGGKILPMAFGVASNIKKDELNQLTSKLAGTGIAIFVEHPEAYKEIETENEKNNIIEVENERI